MTYPSLHILNRQQLEVKPQIKQWGLPYNFVKAWNNVAGHTSKKVFTDASLEQKETNPLLKPVDEQSKLGIAVVFTTNVIDPPAEDIKSFPGLSTQVYTLHLGGTTKFIH